MKHNRAQYVRGCRCKECSDANREYVAAWRQRRRAVGTHRLVHGLWIRKAGLQ